MAVYYSIADLARRWVYTRQGVHKLTRSTSFPAPAITDGSGRIKLWHVADVATFESAHPEVTSEDAKLNKIKRAGYAARLGRQRQA
jgi:hypothetical protein